MKRTADHPQDAALELQTDPDRADEAVLALLLLGLHEMDRAWKGFDWTVLVRLHGKGMISNPAGRAKSIAPTETGLHEAMRLHRVLVAKAPVKPS